MSIFRRSLLQCYYNLSQNKPVTFDEEDYVLYVQRSTTPIYDSSGTRNDDIVGIEVTAGEQDAVVKYGNTVNTITAGSTQQFLFGNINSIDDGTPIEGYMIISGNYTKVTPALVTTAKNTTNYVDCILSVVQYFNNQITDMTNIMNGQTKLSEFIIPNHITNISDYAFKDCKNLSNVVIPQNITEIGNYAFQNCNALSNISIPSGVTNIGNYSFNNCTSLTNINIPNIVQTIGEYAFAGCTSLENIDIPNSVTNLGVGICDMFDDKNYVPLANNMKSVSFGSGITEIPDCAFRCCSLSEIKIPSNIVSVGGSAFYQCNSLTIINIPDNVVTIGGSAFYNCESVEEINIGKGLTSIGLKAFYNCVNCKVVNYNAIDITNIGSGDTHRVFTDVGSNVGGYVLNIGNDVTTLRFGLFNSWSDTGGTVSHNENIKEINLGSSLTTIDDATFEGILSISNITIPSKVNYIGTNVFFDSSLTNIIFEDTELWWISYYDNPDATSGTSIDVTDSVQNAVNLTTTYRLYIWHKGEQITETE